MRATSTNDPADGRRCGACQDYVAQLATVPDTVRLVVVGCGEPSMIQEYKGPLPAVAPVLV